MDHDSAINRALKHEDPLDSLQELTNLAHECQQSLNEIRRLRSGLISTLLEQGKSRRWLSRQLGISHTAVNSLVRDGRG